MGTGWLTCIPAVLLPHSPCRSTTANAPATRQMPIASVVTSNPEKGKNPLECAKRELREVTGILIDDFIEVGRVLHQRRQTYYVNYLYHTDVDKECIVWYYFDENGQVVTGDQEINGQELHFDENGVQTKGGFATDAEGNKHYYDAKTGDLEDVALVEA